MYDGLDVYNGSWGMYNNYVYDRYGDYSFNDQYSFYSPVESGTGRYVWNYTNIGTDQSDNWYYILVDNTYFCDQFG